MPKLEFSVYSPALLSAKEGKRGDAHAFWLMIAKDLEQHQLEARLDDGTRQYLVDAFKRIARGEEPRKVMLLAGQGSIPKETEKQIEIATAVYWEARDKKCSVETAASEISKRLNFAGGDDSVISYYKKWHKTLKEHYENQGSK